MSTRLVLQPDRSIISHSVLSVGDRVTVAYGGERTQLRRYGDRIKL